MTSSSLFHCCLLRDPRSATCRSNEAGSGKVLKVAKVGEDVAAAAIVEVRKMAEAATGADVAVGPGFQTR